MTYTTKHSVSRRSLPKNALKNGLVAALLACSLSAQAEDITLRIAYLRGPSDLALAKENGSLEQALAAQHVKVKWLGPFPAAAPAYEALNAGALDFTTGSSTAFVTAIAAGSPLVFFAYQAMPADGEGIVVRQDSPIRTLKDLQGKKVAVNKGGTGEYLLSRALQNAGIPETAVHKEYLSPADTGSAFVGGHVDAWAIWDPYLTLARKDYQGRLLINGHDLGSENAAGYFVSQAFYQQHPQVIKTVYRVIQQQNAWAKAHPHQAGAIWAQQMGPIGNGLGDTLGEVNTVPVTPIGEVEKRHIHNIAAWYLKQGLIKQLPDIDAHVVDISR